MLSQANFYPQEPHIIAAQQPAAGTWLAGKCARIRRSLQQASWPERTGYIIRGVEREEEAGAPGKAAAAGL